MKCIVIVALAIAGVCLAILLWMAREAPEIDPYDDDDGWGI